MAIAPLPAGSYMQDNIIDMSNLVLRRIQLQFVPGNKQMPGLEKKSFKKNKYARATGIIKSATDPNLLVTHSSKSFNAKRREKAPYLTAFTMGMWIYEPKPPRHVPGTAKLYDEQGTEESPTRGRNLKHATGKESNMLLVPQPSNSLNDPLVWLSLTRSMAIE